MIVSRETTERLERYTALIKKWNHRVNLIAKSTVSDISHRHIRDSLQILQVSIDTKRWVDLGSGGGFPGLVVACVLKDEKPDHHVTLIESDKRKSAFLRSVARELDLNITVKADRIEKIPSLQATTLSARALAPLGTLLSYADRHMHKNGHALFLKGENWRKEVADASEQWSFTHQHITSQTNDSACVLVVSNIEKL